jgi:hypothetical protein
LRIAQKGGVVKKFVLVIVLVLLAVATFVLNKDAILTYEWNVAEVVVYGIFALTVLAVIVIIPYILGTLVIFIYGYKEGYVSLLYSGVENGGFDRAIGVMKGHTIHDDGNIVENPVGTPDVKKSFSWIGLWPTHGAMTFDTEQVKLTNEKDGSVGQEVKTYSKVKYIPIQSTERLLVPGLELADLMSKIDWDVVMTYKMTNAYIAKIKNRGSIKILKAQVMQGLKEIAGTLEYEAALKLKNAIGPAFLNGLVIELNKRESGYGTLSETIGYTLISLDIVGIELSGGKAGAMADAYASIKIEKIKADNVRVAAEAEQFRLEKVGVGTAKAAGLMVDQVLRRLEAQKELTPAQAMALAIEVAKPQVIGANPLISLDPKWEQKAETEKK